MGVRKVKMIRIFKQNLRKMQKEFHLVSQPHRCYDKMKDDEINENLWLRQQAEFLLKMLLKTHSTIEFHKQQMLDA